MLDQQAESSQQAEVGNGRADGQQGTGEQTDRQGLDGDRDVRQAKDRKQGRQAGGSGVGGRGADRPTGWAAGRIVRKAGIRDRQDRRWVRIRVAGKHCETQETIWQGTFERRGLI